MKIRLIGCAIMSSLLLMGCEQAPPETAAADTGLLNEAELQQAADELFETDIAFAAAVQELGVAEAFRQFAAEDAVQLPDGGLPVAGRQAIYDELRSITDGMDFSLTWEPVEAQVAGSGDFGFTWGVYYFESLDELGAPYVAEGKYVYLWSYQDDRWQLILDITNQTEPYYETALEEAMGEGASVEGGATAE